MLNIVCVQSGNYLGRGAQYVNILFDMVARNISDTQPYTFVCFTDNSEDLNPAIKVRELYGNLHGWYNKLYLFKNEVFPAGDRIVYFDLDTAITGGLDDIIKYEGKFSLLKDFYHDRYGPGVMLWRAGEMGYIWEEYEKSGCPQDFPLGDLTWINKCLLEKPDIIQDIFPGQVGSYKVHARFDIPKGMRVVCFHGLPRPHDCAGWVEHVWKIGGGTTAEFNLVGNTPLCDLERNIRHSITLDLPKLMLGKAHSGHAIIVGGGPSLKEEIEGLRARQQHGQNIFSTNGTYQFLMDNGIVPDFHIMLDAREEMADFVPNIAYCIYSSQCHPKVFSCAKDRWNYIRIWHHNAIDIFDILGRDTGDAIIAGGQSVGLKAIAIAHMMGYREFHLYGMDSSYSDDRHHAYAQPLNDNEGIIDVMCDGVTFRAAPWMVTQAEQFKDLAKELVDNNCTLTIHGSGLIPFIAERL